MTQETNAKAISEQAVSVPNGSLDAYIIDCFAKPPMLIPQNIVLSALDSRVSETKITWHDRTLPVFHVNHPDQKNGIALVVEGDKVEERFILMCDKMPEPIRLSIAKVTDVDEKNIDPSILYFVKFSDQVYHVPNFFYIQHKLGL